jgi:hypothetical protein
VNYARTENNVPQISKVFVAAGIVLTYILVVIVLLFKVQILVVDPVCASRDVFLI